MALKETKQPMDDGSRVEAAFNDIAFHTIVSEIPPETAERMRHISQETAHGAGYVALVDYGTEHPDNFLG